MLNVENVMRWMYMSKNEEYRHMNLDTRWNVHEVLYTFGRNVSGFCLVECAFGKA